MAPRPRFLVRTATTSEQKEIAPNDGLNAPYTFANNFQTASFFCFCGSIYLSTSTIWGASTWYKMVFDSIFMLLISTETSSASIFGRVHTHPFSTVMTPLSKWCRFTTQDVRQKSERHHRMLMKCQWKGTLIESSACYHPFLLAMWKFLLISKPVYYIYVELRLLDSNWGELIEWISYVCVKSSLSF